MNILAWGESIQSRLDQNAWRRITILFLGIGVVTRIVQYLANRSLWLHEVCLAQNILGRSFEGLSQVADDATLQNYWQDHFVPLPPRSFHQLRLIGDLLGNTFTFVIPPFPNFAELAVGIGGVVAITRNKVRLLVAPLLFASVASSVHQYPFYQRFSFILYLR